MPRKLPRALAALLFVLVSWAAAAQVPFTLTPAIAEALARVSEDNLRGNLSFLASDLLEGRDTPSRGLDLAAEYIAAQFRKARLEPAGDDGYFQTAPFLLSQPKTDTFRLQLQTVGKTVEVKDGVAVQSAAALAIEHAPALNVALDASELPKAEDVAGKVIFAEWRGRERGQMPRISALRGLRPALVVVVDPEGRLAHNTPDRRLVDPEERAAAAPWITIRNDELLAAVHAGLTGAVVSAHLDAPEETAVKLRNVIGVLRGSDPALRDTYVLVTAHYDHIGIQPGCSSGDCIYNGANDDGSGTVSVIEIAVALASLKERPRRSIVFMTFFGEEEGGYGARYYTRHPVFPLQKTVGDVNLEQLGRTDANNGPQVRTATFTGFEFSGLPRTFEAAGKLTGIKVHNTSDSDDFFNRSDNLAFAEAGIPAHTACVAYEYPDYHGVGDSWEKIDYANMAAVDRMLALGTVMLADSPAPPHWNESKRRAAHYVEAWRRLRAQDAVPAASVKPSAESSGRAPAPGSPPVY